MATLELSGGHVNDAASVTLPGLAAIIKQMRWRDLETFAAELEELRLGAHNKVIVAKLVHDWAS